MPKGAGHLETTGLLYFGSLAARAIDRDLTDWSTPSNEPVFTGQVIRGPQPPRLLIDDGELHRAADEIDQRYEAWDFYEAYVENYKLALLGGRPRYRRAWSEEDEKG